LTTVSAFINDNRPTAYEAAERVREMRPGDVVELPAASGVLGHPCIEKLNPIQSWTLYEAPQTGGIVGFLGVGSGKSLLSLLVPLALPDCKKAVLIIEPKQREHYRSQYLRLREHFRVSSIVFDDGVPGHTVPGTPPLHLISYSVLSQTKNSDLLDDRNPDVLILDEAHRACGVSAIGRRVDRFMISKLKEREAAVQRGETALRARAVRLFDWSGTLEVKSIEDTQALSLYSLGMGSPLPLDPAEAAAWSQVIDPVRQPDRKSATAKALQKAFAGKVFDAENLSNLLSTGPEEAIREAFQRRRAETLGVITAAASSINAYIYLSERKAPTMPANVREALLDVRTKWIRPDGDEIVEKVQQIATAKNVACGFYGYWSFSKHPCACVPNRGPNDLLCEQCRLIADWYARRKLYSKEVRSQLLRGEVFLDSPKLCWDAAERFWRDPPYRGELPKWQSEAWPAWREIEGKVEYEERVKWLSFYLVEDAAAWALDNKGVVWFTSVDFGRKVSELTGLPYFNGGPGCEERLRAEKGDRSIICSISALASGTDGLQHLFSDQLIAEIPASNATARGFEQLLGRLHRRGQLSDAVNTFIYVHTIEFKDALRKAVAEAEFNKAMLGLQPLLLLADIDVEL
jgi:hypothetical protein